MVSSSVRLEQVVSDMQIFIQEKKINTNESNVRIVEKLLPEASNKGEGEEHY